METYFLKSNAGQSFTDASTKAKEKAVKNNQLVMFDFNNILCLVTKTTNISWLYRDYSNAHLMKWDTVGPLCFPKYDNITIQKIRKANLLNERKMDAREKKYQLKCDNERKSVLKKIKDIKIELKDRNIWDKQNEVNTDPYGRTVIQYADEWARLMQIEISKGKSVKACAEKTSFQLSYLGITGFMYGCAVQILSACWKYGEELRIWHNKEYGHEGEGVVNPAILKIKS